MTCACENCGIGDDTENMVFVTSQLGSTMMVCETCAMGCEFKDPVPVSSLRQALAEPTYKVRYRGCYKGEEPPTGEAEVGKVENWTMRHILWEINRDRSSEWTDFDETDWEEGLDEWTWYEPVKD